MGGGRDCPGCGKPDIPHYRASCGSCWRRLPGRLHRAIGPAWRDRNCASPSQRVVIREVLEWFRANRVGA